jgi:hypothetical protein
LCAIDEGAGAWVAAGTVGLQMGPRAGAVRAAARVSVEDLPGAGFRPRIRLLDLT